MISFSQLQHEDEISSYNNKKQISFHNLTVEEGLSQNSVVSIAQDSIGYMWFATQDGLNRYDGRTFTYFNKQYQDVTRSNYTQLGQLLSDSFGDLWSYNSNEIIERFNYQSQTFDSIASISNGTVIHRKGLETIWIGTLEKGLFSINLKSYKIESLFDEELKNVSVFEIYNTENSIYLGTSKGVFKINDNIISHINFTENYPVCSIVKRDQQIIFGTYGKGVHVIDLESNNILSELNNGLSKNLNVQDLFFDSKSRLWIATYGEGLYLLRTDNNLLNFKANKEDPFALHYNDILKVFEDITGNIWFGSDGLGLSYYDEHLVKFNKITSKQVPENINVDVVRSITVDSLNVIWLGTSGKGLTRIDRKKNSFKTLTTQNSNLSSNRIMSLLMVDNHLMIGHQSKGLQILRSDGKFQSFPELNKRAIWKIYKDSNSDIWLCTRSGLIKFNIKDGIIEEYNSNNSNLPNNIRTIEQGKSNTLWIGTDSKGLYELNTLSKKINKVNSVQDKIKSLYYSNGVLWIGTNGNGIIKIDEETQKVKEYDFEFGLANKVVYGLLKDENENFWVSTNKGISRFNPNHPYKHYVENFTIENGLQTYEFNTGAYFETSDGQFYFGGIEGVNWFHPNDITYNEILPKTIISKFEVFGDSHQIISNQKFKYNENTMTFSFASLHFSHPGKNFFSYKLENHDDDWSASSHNDFAHYTNLPPGDYIFKVMSSNYEGIWNKAPTIFKFTITKPWYKTNLAYVIYGFLFALLLYSFYRYFKFKWKIETQLRLEQAEAERLQQLDNFKTKLYTNISHEFRTPLTLIFGPIDKQLNNTKLSKEDKDELTLVKRNANRLLNLVNQMLDLSKIESGNLKLVVTKGNLSMLLKQIVSAFEYKAREKQIHFQFNISPIESAWFDKDVIQKTVSNLLSNAIKYAPEKGKVTFEVTQQDGQVIITVINNGNILTNEDLPKLFQRFYRANKKNDGAGIGLSLVKELVILSHGNIVAHTMNEDDIQFTITLPIEISYYNQSEIIYEEQIDYETINDHLEDGTLNKINTELLDNNKPLLLIVEDDNDIRQFVKSNFDKQYKIIEAPNGKIGIDKAITHIPDIIISDIMMPVIDGIELCNSLKNDHRTSHIPVILLTAKVGEKNEIVGLRTGADDYITKPFNIEKLRVKVEKLIQLRQLLQERYEQTFQFQSKEIEVSSVEHQFLKNLQDVIDDHITDPSFNAQAFSKKMLMNRMQLHRKLKALTNLTTSEFLRSHRLKLAIDVLKKSDATIAEVAYQVGFNTPSYFIKSFKKFYNCTPSEYISKQ